MNNLFFLFRSLFRASPTDGAERSISFVEWQEEAVARSYRMGQNMCLFVGFNCWSISNIEFYGMLHAMAMVRAMVHHANLMD